MGRVPRAARTRLPEGTPLADAPRRQEVAALPLAGGGATGGRIRLDPAQFRDQWRRSRDEQTTQTVAGDIAGTMSALDTTSDKKGTKKAAVQQFVENLRRLHLESSKAPDENLLDPYHQAFNELIPQDPEKAAFILEQSKLPPDVVSALGSRGFKTLFGQDPKALVQAFENAGVSKQNATALLAGVLKPSKAPATPAAQAPASLPQLKEKMRAELEAAPKKEVLDTDEYTLPTPQRDEIPLSKNVQTRVLAQPTNDWTPKQIARGWRSIVAAPYGVAGKSAPRVGDTRIANVYIEREAARLQSAITAAGGQNTAKGSKFKSVLDDSTALAARARASAESDLQSVVSQRQAAVESAKSPAEMQEARRRLAAAQAMLTEHLASFDAMTNPTTVGQSVAPQGPGGVAQDIIEVLSSRLASDLAAKKSQRVEPNPNFGKTKIIYEQPQASARQTASPVSRLTDAEKRVLAVPQRQQSPLDRLLERKENNTGTAQETIAGLKPDEQVALKRAQELAAALRTGRQISLQQEVAPNDIEGMQQVPLAREAAVFDDTAQGKSLVAALRDIVRRHPVVGGLLDTRPAIAPAPSDPVAPLGRENFFVSLTHLLGGYDNARKFHFENRPPNVPGSFKPLVKQAENVRALEAITGQRFIPQLPAESSTVGPLNRQPGVRIKRINGEPRIVFDDPKKKGKKTGRVYFPVNEEKPPVIEGSFGERAGIGVGSDPAVAEALKIIDAEIPLKGNRINVETLEKDYPEVVAKIRKIMAGSKASGPIILRNQTTIDTQPWQRRQMLAVGRGKFNRIREQLDNIIKGRSRYIPSVLRRQASGAVPAEGAEAPAKGKPKYDPWAGLDPAQRELRKQEAAEFTQRMLDQGGIFPLDEHAPYWRGHYYYFDPDDGQVYAGRLTPNVLARAISQQLLIDNPNEFRVLRDMIRRSMEVYERLPPTASARQYQTETGAPRMIVPTTNYVKALEKIMQERGIAPILRSGNPWDDNAPAPRPGKKFVPISPISGLKQ